MYLPVFTLSKAYNILFSIAILPIMTLPALAHELWLEPEQYQIDLQTRLVVNIVNGQKFRGHALPYLPNKAARFDLVTSAGVSAVPARAGDRPALDMAPIGAGLQVLVYQAENSTLTYREWEKFQAFVEHKDLGISREGHLARGIPEVGFKEVYSRYSKVLLGVLNATGADVRVGLETELVALANPYTDNLTHGLPVQLFYRADIRAHTQIEVFDRDDEGNVSLSVQRTNADGIAHIAVTSGHTYMLDSVVLRQPDAALAAQTGAVYESLWANLTFQVPASD